MIEKTKAINSFPIWWFAKLGLVLCSCTLKLCDASIVVWAGFSILVYFVICFSYIRIGGNLISAYELTILLLIMFHSGQVVVYLFNPDRYLPVFIEFDSKIVARGYAYSVLCIQLFDLAYTCTKQIMGRSENKVKCSKAYSITARQVSTIMLILLTPVIVYETIKKVLFSLQNGYMSLYAYDGAGYSESSLMPYLRNLFVFMCIMNITSLKDDKKRILIPSFLLLIYGGMMFVLGSRSGALSIVLPLIVIYFSNIKKKPNKGYFKYIVLVIVFMFGSVFMSKYRLTNDMQTQERIKDAVNYAIESNPITETFVEMGGSLKPLLHCINIFDGKEAYKCGTSYGASIMLLIPNIFHILGDTHPAAKYTGLAEWLMNYKKMDHGPGFSIVAESYYNFGEFGCLVFILWGVMFCLIFESIGKKDAMKNFIAYSTLVLIFFLIRGAMSDFIRYFIYEVIVVAILINFLSFSFERRGGY